MICLLLSFLIPLSAIAKSETSSKGELRFESRFFNDDKNELTEDFGYGLAGRIEVDNKWRYSQSRVQIFSRVDRKDPSRQRLNIEELYSQEVHGPWVIFLGFKTINWSTAEAFHPTDIINSRNFDSPLENAEKLGEAMAGFQYLSNSLNFTAFFMPLLARPQLPSQTNRLSFAPQSTLFAVDEVQFVNKKGQLQESNEVVPQWAIRTQVPSGNWEFNLYWVSHFDRTDFSVVQNLNTGSLVPLLTEVNHYGFSFQYIWESWIIKSENVFRDFQEETTIPALSNTLTKKDYGISSLALEYLASHSSGSDTTYILEFQEIHSVEDEFRELINPFQRDLLFGIRHSYNDEKGKTLFLGIIADVERGKEIIVSGRYSQRLSDVWKINTSFRYIDAPFVGQFDLTGIRPLNNDHQLNINISRFF